MFVAVNFIFTPTLCKDYSVGVAKTKQNMSWVRLGVSKWDFQSQPWVYSLIKIKGGKSLSNYQICLGRKRVHRLSSDTVNLKWLQHKKKCSLTSSFYLLLPVLKTRSQPDLLHYNYNFTAVYIHDVFNFCMKLIRFFLYFNFLSISCLSFGYNLNNAASSSLPYRLESLKIQII